jgi:hypothetical protein
MVKWREVLSAITNMLPHRMSATLNGSASIESHATSSPRFVYLIATASPTGVLATMAGCTPLLREVHPSASRPIESA